MRRDIDGEPLLEVGHPGLAEAVGQRSIRQHPRQGVSHRRRIRHGHKNRVRLVGQHTLHAGKVGAHDRAPQCHGLERHTGRALVQRRDRQHVGCAQQIGDVVPVPEERDRSCRRRVMLQRRGECSRRVSFPTGDEHPDVGYGLEKSRCRGDQIHMRLLVFLATDSDHHRIRRRDTQAGSHRGTSLARPDPQPVA